MRKVLATDLDGTLFYPRRKISMIAKRNYRMLEGHFAKQGKVVIVTGRNVPFSKKVAKKLKHDIDIIACSGSYVEAEGKILKDEVLPGGVGQDIYDILDQKIPGFVVSVLGRNGDSSPSVRMAKIARLFLGLFLSRCLCRKACKRGKSLKRNDAP